MSDESLPNSWTSIKLAEVGQWRGGGTPSKANPAFWTNGTIPWVSPKDMKQPRLSTAQDLITESAVESSATNLIAAGSVLLVTRSGILAHSLPVAVNLVPVALNQDIKAVTPHEITDAEYLRLIFQCFERDILNTCRKGGTTVHSIEFPALQDFSIPLPPLTEQKRIVAKIEELFSELEAGEESLRVARRQLGVYRQSLLKQAFEGKLTAQWRTQNPAQLAPPATNSADGPTAGLPPGWMRCRFGDVARIRNGYAFKSEWFKDRRENPSEVPIIRQSQLQGDTVDITHAVYVDAAYLRQHSGFTLVKGDILIGMSGSIGKVCRYELDEVALQNQRTGKIELFEPEAHDPRFLGLFLATAEQSLIRLAKGMGVQNISSKDIASLPFVRCSFPEQQEIVRKLDEQFEVIERNEREIDAALKRSEALRQAILKKAFTGRLVPQIVTDEPASALLARLHAERGSHSAPARRVAAAKASRGPTQPEPDLFPEIAAFKPLGKTDLQAGIVALAIDRFDRRKQFLGHTNAEKIVHLADALVDLQLDRHPVKDAAGPNDFRRAKQIEHRARAKGWFTVTHDGPVYHYHAGRNLPALLIATERTLGPKFAIVENLLEQLHVLKDTKAIEIFATVYAAWNNLLLRQTPITDEAIVTEARENWHRRKLDIPRNRFFGAIAWMTQHGFVPKGTGQLVASQKQQAILP
ncbi:MAG: restriction endonuclease subunit S [Opitutae bacterium]|nr:restriction endonuclease subunit S [Opitutae bacterium]